MAECKDCGEKARFAGIESRAVRVAWTVATLQGMRPATDAPPEKVAVNVDHTLYLAKARSVAAGGDWDDMGLDDKIGVVESLVDFWPKEGVEA